MYKVSWDAEALKDLKKIDAIRARSIFKKVEEYLVLDPKGLGKPLSHRYKYLYRYRYGKYRIIYEIIDKQIEIIVVKVGIRATVYEK